MRSITFACDAPSCKVDETFYSVDPVPGWLPDAWMSVSTNQERRHFHSVECFRAFFIWNGTFKAE